MSSPTSQDDLTFAEARGRLDAILAELEADAGDVDQLAARLKEASELIRFCRMRLSAARHEVRRVVAEIVPEEQPAPVDAPEPPADEPGEDQAETAEPDDLPF